MCIYHLVQHGLEGAPLYANRSGPTRWQASGINAHTSDNSDYETDGDQFPNHSSSNDDYDHYHDG